MDLNPTSTTAVLQQTQLPQWYQQLLEGVIGRATGVADAPYQPYTGPRIESFTPDQLAAFQAVQQQQGTWGQQFDPASQLALASGQSNVLGQTMPYYGQAAGLSALEAGQPYIGQAAQTFPGAASEYMSPYMGSVLDELSRRAGQNLQENILPAVNDQFIGAGQSNSSRNQEFVNRAVSDTQRELLGAQSAALQSGYGQAGQLFGQDQSRLAGLAGTAGGLQSSDINKFLGVGQGVGSAANIDIGNLRGASSLLGSLAGTGQQLGLTDAAALQGIGQQQQQLGQQGLGVAYGDFLEQRDWPRAQTAFLSDVTRGISPPISTSSLSTQPATQSQLQPESPSLLSQIGGLGAGLLGLGGASGLFRKQGGRVKKQGLDSLVGKTPAMMARGGAMDPARMRRKPRMPKQGLGALMGATTDG